MKKFKNLISLIFLVFALPIGIFLIGQKTEFFQKAFGTNANIVVDLNNTNPTQKIDSWRNLAQGGEEKGRMLSSVTDKISVLKPKYIRLDHIFDSYDLVSKDESGNLIFNWTNLDQTISDIIKTGAKPFISLSYMPPAISSGNVTDYPSDWNDWQKTVTATVEHISGKSGFNINDVYYEVWNEPDLFGDFKIRGKKDYLTLYTQSAIAAQKARNVNDFKIGGPATTGFYENWLNKLLEYSQTENIRLDFLSWHKYSKKLSDYEADLENSQRYRGYEMVISEIGPNSENDPVYDGNFSAFHTIATTVLLEGSVDKIFTFEIKDGPGSFKNWGRWGILTHDKFGIPEEKPRFKALQFLNRLSNSQNVIVEGNGSWVKAMVKRNENTVQLLLVNYDHLGRHNESVPVRLTNLPGLTGKLTRYDFFGSSSTTELNLPDNTWESTIYMLPNSASIFEFNFN